MKRLLIILGLLLIPLGLSADVDTVQGLNQPGALQGQAWYTGTQAVGGIQGATGGVAAGGAPTNYTSDANIISYWMFEDATGATRLDATANNNDLADNSDTDVVRSATKIQGTYSANYAALYSQLELADASISPATFPGKATTGATGAFSVGGWFQLANVTASQTLIEKGSEAGDQQSWRLGYLLASDRFEFRVSTNGYATTVIVGGTEPVINTWYHIVGVYTGSYIKLYVGTVAGASAEDASQVAFSSALFRSTGSLIFGLGEGLQHYGLVDEVFVFSDALSGAEVEEIRAHGLAGER